ncbi:MAG: UPF0147 family protein [Candidatus Aenigmatarchaeota archaeon]
MQELQAVMQSLEELSQDRTVPRNVRTALVKAKEDLANEKLDLGFRVSSAISILDEVANDINLPPYSRTQVWNIVSSLEAINAALKKK